MWLGLLAGVVALVLLPGAPASAEPVGPALVGPLPLWVDTAAADNRRHVASVAVDPVRGSVVTAGFSSTAYVTTAHNPAGAVLWERRQAVTPDGFFLEVRGSAIDASTGAVYITGTDFLTVAYGPQGQLLWTDRRPDDGVAEAVVTDPVRGIVYVVGHDFDPGGPVRNVIVAYDRHGQELWTTSASGPDVGDRYAVYAAVDPVSGLLVVGTDLRVKRSDQPFLETDAYTP